MDERQIAQLETIKNKVRGILGGDPSGHADDHVERVAFLAERFASECNEPVDLYEVLLTAWLHDIDDYKLVGKAQAEKLTNAVNSMVDAGVDTDLCQAVLENIAAIGYSKRLDGQQPRRLAGQLVSDADMCDAIGAVNGNTHDTDGFINHFFEKLLKLKGLMLTEPGRIEARKRQHVMVDFLRAYFREKNVPEWSEFLEGYLLDITKANDLQ